MHSPAHSYVINIRNKELIAAFGERVRQLRQEKGLTMEQLAANANIEYKQLSQVERGKTNATISTIYALAKALNISVGELMNLSGF